MREVPPDHEFSVEVPGRHGKDTVTGACVCRRWSSSVHLGHVGIPDVQAAEARLRELYARDHESEIPDIRHFDAQMRRLEHELEDLRENGKKKERAEAILNG